MSEGRIAIIEKFEAKGKVKLVTYYTSIRNTAGEPIDAILGYWLNGKEIAESRTLHIKENGVKTVENSILGHYGVGKKVEIKLFAVKRSEKSIFKVDKFEYQGASACYVKEMDATEVLPA